MRNYFASQNNLRLQETIWAYIKKSNSLEDQYEYFFQEEKLTSMKNEQSLNLHFRKITIFIL